MKSKMFFGISTVLFLGLFGSPLFGQKLHVNDRWDECSFLLDPALTQEAWHQFTGEAGLVTYFRPLNSAKPLGVKNFEIALLDWGTTIDDADAAWNDTFSHPDSTHTLFDGNALLFPGLMFRIGATNRIDIGAYFTKQPSANYGFYGGQVQYNFLNDSEKNLAAAVRFSFTQMFGPEDLNQSVYGLDVLASKDVFRRFSPYAGVSGYLARAQETTSKVNLENENVFGLQGMVGMVVKISVLRIGGEINFANVLGYSFKVAFAH